MTATNAVVAEDIDHWFGSVHAIRGISLSLERGRIHAIVGPNGAGKSTFFGILAGDLSPTGGRILVNGRDVSRHGASQRVADGIGRTFQVARVFERLTVRENVLVAVCSALGESRKMLRGPSRQALEKVAESMHSVRLETLSEVVAENLSLGDKKRLEFACALSGDPEIVLLDEPTAGMATDARQVIVELIRQQWEERHLTIALCEHDMGVIFDLAQVLTVFHDGQILCSGDPQEISHREDVKRLYLGEGDTSA